MFSLRFNIEDFLYTTIVVARSVFRRIRPDLI